MTTPQAGPPAADPDRGRGGSYVIEGGVRRRIAGTDDHPEGNRARDADGRPAGTPPAPATAGGEG